MQFPAKTVYLAGPISGLTYADARDGWRKEFASLMPEHIHCLSPMRAKEFLSKAQDISGLPTSYTDQAIATPSGIVTRDHNDVKSCDAMVANFLGADRASIGTAIEFGWANAYRKPIVMLIEKDGFVRVKKGDGTLVAQRNPHWHAMMSEIGGYLTDDMEEAAHIINHILTPGT